MKELFCITRSGQTHFGLIVIRATMMFEWPLNQTYYCMLLSCVCAFTQLFGII